MSTVAPEDVAEDLDAYMLRSPDTTREDRGYVVLIDGPGPSPLNRFACRLRLQPDPKSEIAKIRRWFRDLGKESFTWKLGVHTTPPNLEVLLRAQGAHEDEAEPEHTAMVLEVEPPDVEGIEVRVVESYEDFAQSAEIMFIGFGGSLTTEEVAIMRAAMRERYADYLAQATSRRYLAYSSGDAVGMAAAIRTSAGVVALSGGATLPGARGRGAYRALVHARWVDARKWGAKALVTQASGMSRPILERLGFRPGSSVVELIDTTGLGRGPADAMP